MIRSYNESGMKLRDWLEQNNITRDKFYYWRRKLRYKSLDEFIENNNPGKVEFIEMPIHRDIQEATPTVAASVNINGCRINIYDTASVSFIMYIVNKKSLKLSSKFPVFGKGIELYPLSRT